LKASLKKHKIGSIGENMAKVPVRVRSPSTDSNDASVDGEPAAQASRSAGADVGGQDTEIQETGIKPEAGRESLDVWRDRALRLQAEIENFRKRQRRLAEQQIATEREQIATEREQLLRAFTRVANDLERALDAQTGIEGLRQGVQVTYRNLMRLLNKEGVESIPAKGAWFDPVLHEAVSTVSHLDAGVEPQRVVEVTERGYRIGDRLLSPARVIVAV
jgi:molecular chaperone GrpE